MLGDLDALKRYLGDIGDADNDLLADILKGVSGRIERYTGRIFAPDPPLEGDPPEDTADPVTRTVVRDLSKRVRRVRIPDARALTEVKIDGVVVTGWKLRGGDLPDRPAPWLKLPGDQLWEDEVDVALTGRFGFNPTPDDLLNEAVYPISARHWHKRQAMWGDAVELPQGGLVSYFRQFDPSVRDVIESYVIREVLVA
jgi:hypothetical protein